MSKAQVSDANIYEFFNYLQKNTVKQNLNKNELIDALKLISHLIHPFIPHLSEELWSKLGGDGLIIEQKWPKASTEVSIKKTKIAIQINGKTKDVLVFLENPDKNNVLKMIEKNIKIQKHLENKKIKRTIFVPNKILNLVT